MCVVNQIFCVFVLFLMLKVHTGQLFCKGGWELQRFCPRLCCIKNYCICPGWYGSVGWAPAWKQKGCRFDSLSGHMPVLWARSPVRGVQEATDCCFSHTSMFLRHVDISLLSSSLPLSKKVNKILKNYCIWSLSKQPGVK